MALSILYGDAASSPSPYVVSFARPGDVTGVRLAATGDTITEIVTLTCTVGAGKELDLGGAKVAVTVDAEVTLHTAGGKHVTAYVDFSALPGSTTSESIAIVKDDVSTASPYSVTALWGGNRGAYWMGSSGLLDYSIMVHSAAPANALVIQRADGLSNFADLRSSSDGETFAAVSGCVDYDASVLSSAVLADRSQDVMWGGLWTSPKTHHWYRIRLHDGTQPWCAGVRLLKLWTPSADPETVGIAYDSGLNVWRSDGGTTFTWLRRTTVDEYAVTWPRLSWATDGPTLETLAAGPRNFFLWDSDGTRTKPAYTSGILKAVAWIDPRMDARPCSPLSYDRFTLTMNFREQR